MHKIKLKRGRLANIPRLSLAEPAFTTDSEDLFVGGSSKNIRFVNASKTVTNVYYDSETGNLKKTIDGVDYDAADLHAMAEHDYPGVYSGFVTKEASGDIITIEDGADNVPLKSASFEIKPIQNLNGQDAPYPPGGGANKFDLSTFAYRTNHGITFTRDGNDIVISGTSDGVDSAYLNFSGLSISGTGSNVIFIIKGSAANSNVTLRVTGDTSGNSRNIKLTSAEMSDGFAYSSETFSGYIRVDVGTDFSTPLRVQVFAAVYTGTAPSFAPYSNICPIEGYTGAQITRTGKNRYSLPIGADYWTNNAGATHTNDDGKLVISTAAQETSGVYAANAGTSKLVYFFRSAYYPGGNFTVSFDIVANSSCSVIVGFEVGNNVVVAANSTVQRVSFTVSSAQTGAFIIYDLTASAAHTITVSNMQIEEGSAATEYEPYNGAVYSISWADEAGTIYKGSAVYKGAGKWKITPTWKMIDGGSVNWTYVSSWHNTNLFYIGQTILSDMKYIPNGRNAISSVYPTVTQTDFGDKRMYVGSTYIAGNATIGISDESYTSAADFKTAMSGVQILYELATPVTFTVNGPDPATLLGLNNIWCNIAPLSITYRVNPADALKNVAQQDGNYPKLVAGLSKNLIGKSFAEDKEPYPFRKAPNAAMVSEAIVGGTVAFNQLVQNGNFDSAGVAPTPSSNANLSIVNNTLFMTPKDTSQSGSRYCNFAVRKMRKSHKYFCTADYYMTGKGNGSLSLINMAANYGGEYTVLGVLRVPNASIVLNSWTTASSIYAYAYDDFNWVPQVTFDTHPDIRVRNLMHIDLTQMFGSVIADYIYSLEQATAGAGVAFFRSLFSKSYYAYSDGELMSVKTSAHKMVGFNQWDEEWEVGTINSETGDNQTGTSCIRCKNYIPVIPGQTYYMDEESTAWNNIYAYATDKTYIGLVPVVDRLVTIPSGVSYMRFRCVNAYGTTYKGDICINISNAAKNGTYQPYEELTYPLDPVELRGMFKLDSSNKLYCNGDIYKADGSVTRKYGIVDLGTLTWSTAGANGWTQSSVSPTNAKSVITSDKANILATGFVTMTANNVYTGNYDKSISLNNTTVQLCDSSLASKTSAEIKTALSGVYLVYELATPITETAEPYAEEQVVYSGGTEEYIDERGVAIPVGHDSKYYKDIAAAVDGIPEAPSEDGTYTLKVVVTSGKASYSWVSA